PPPPSRRPRSTTTSFPRCRKNSQTPTGWPAAAATIACSRTPSTNGSPSPDRRPTRRARWPRNSSPASSRFDAPAPSCSRHARVRSCRVWNYRTGPMQIRMIHNSRDRDSLFMPMDANTIDLMLQYNIPPVRCEPTTHFHADHPSGNGHGILHDPPYGNFNLDPWQPAEWMAFRSNFVGIIMRHWDRKFELTPNRPWYRARHAAGAPVAARITCSLSLGLVDTRGHANHTYYIVKPQETTFRSFANRSLRVGLFTHRYLSLESSTERTRLRRGVEHRITYLQSTVLHEFGHTLGLGHINGSGNNDAAYEIGRASCRERG